MKKWGRLLVILLAVLVLGGAKVDTAKAADSISATCDKYTFQLSGITIKCSGGYEGTTYKTHTTTNVEIKTFSIANFNIGISNEITFSTAIQVYCSECAEKHYDYAPSSGEGSHNYGYKYLNLANRSTGYTSLPNTKKCKSNTFEATENFDFSGGEGITSVKCKLTVKSQSGATIPHSYFNNNWTEDSETGKWVKVCGVCGQTVEHVCSASTTSETWERDPITKEMVQKCTICGQTRNIDNCNVNTLIHVEAKAATCVSAGNKEYWECPICKRCYTSTYKTDTKYCTSEDMVKNINPDNHKWGDWEWDEDGTHRRTCQEEKCKKVEECKAASILTKHRNTLSSGGIEFGHTWTCGTHNCLKYFQCSSTVPTCREEGKCKYCGQAVLSKNKKNHVNADGTPGTQDWQSYNTTNTKHALVWSCCGEATSIGQHKGGSASCTYPAVCRTCGLSYGDINPDGHAWGDYTSNGNGKHSETCMLNSNHIKTSDCHGGTATCTKQAICEDCEEPYGTALGHSMTHTEAKAATCVDEGNVEYWYCSRCKTYFSDKDGTNEIAAESVKVSVNPDAHDWGDYVSNGNGTHYQVCKNDANHHSEPVNCHGGTATCEEQAICADCNTAYGTVLGHDWGAYVSNANGTHYQVCKNDESHHSEPTNCHGGTATCEAQAICEDCNTAYGTVLGHDWGAYVSNANGTHYQVCKNDANHHSEPVNCHGGTATCEEQAICADCNTAYGTVLGHDWGDYASNGDGTHSQVCTRDSNHRNTPVACSGGAATCQNKAVCDICQQPYGDLVPCKDEDSDHYCDYNCGAMLTDHDYTAVVTKPTCLKKGFTTYTCGICGDSYVDDITSATGHWYGLWSLDQQHAHTATCRNAGCTHTAVTACTQYEVTTDENGTVATVCPVCGEFGETLFELLEDASIAAIDKEPLPIGEAIVRGMETPFDGVLYAFTAAYEFAGEVQPFEHAVSISLKLDETLTNFRLVRVDVTPATEDAERTEVWTELEFTLEDGLLTFETEHEGLFLLLPVA